MPKGRPATEEVTVRGYAEELAACIIAGGKVFHAYCHECKKSGIYYGKVDTPDGFLGCTCGRGALDLCPMGPELMRPRSIHMPDGTYVKRMELDSSAIAETLKDLPLSAIEDWATFHGWKKDPDAPAGWRHWKWVDSNTNPAPVFEVVVPEDVRASIHRLRVFEIVGIFAAQADVSEREVAAELAAFASGASVLRRCPSIVAGGGRPCGTVFVQNMTRKNASPYCSTACAARAAAARRKRGAK